MKSLFAVRHLCSVSTHVPKHRRAYAPVISLLSLLLTLCVQAQPPCATAPPGLVSWWRADNNVLDETGVNNGQTPFGMAYDAGRVGQAFSFNGGWSRLSVPDNPSLKLASLSIEGWINVRGNNGFILFRGDNRPGLDAYVLNMSENGQLLFQVQSLTDAVLIAAPISFNEWKHVAATLDDASSDMKLYIDGVLAAQTNTPVRPILDLDPQSDPALGIGNHGGTFHLFPFTGLIDEIALYSRALTQQEIQAIFQASAAGKCALPPSSGVPQIASFGPVQAPAGSSVTITGANFSPIAAANVVYFGPVRGVVTAASATALTVSVPPGATYSPITVTVNGSTAVSRQLFLPVFNGNGADIDASTFAPRFDVPTSNGPIHVVAADLDSDGRPDLVVANAYAHVVTIHQNLTPPGQAVSLDSFGAPVVFPLGGGRDNPYRMTVADVDGDGKLDLVVPDRNANLLYIFPNQCGTGPITTQSFGVPVVFPVGADVRDTVVGDLDGDGLPEIVMAAYGSATVSVLHHNAHGPLSTNSFGQAFELPAQAGTYAVVISDLDGDGWPDVAALNSDGASLSLFRNLGGKAKLGPASFAPRVDIPAGAGAITLAVGDIDGDGKNDLVACSYLAEIVSLFHNDAVPGTLATNSFGLRVDLPANGWAHTAGLGDLNGDGKPDIGLVTELPSHFSVYQNRGTSQMNPEIVGQRIDFPTGWNAWGLAVGDLDGDGRPDVVFGNAYDSSLSIYRNVANLTGAPVIQTQPANQVVHAGETATFSVSATGSTPLSYQWRFGTTDLLGKTESVLSIPAVLPEQAGAYSVLISNAFGSVVSSNAVLMVLPTLSVVINYTNFETAACLNRQGNAATVGPALRVTPALQGQLGTAWYCQKLPLLGGFSTEFSFKITDIGCIPGIPQCGGDGFSFIVQNVGPEAPSPTAPDEGLDTNNVAVSFNTFWNWPGSTYPEPSDNFIGILVDRHWLATVDLNPLGINMSDGQVHRARIVFNGIELMVDIDGVPVLTNAPPMAGCDAAGMGWVGFGARCGAAWENHDILSWSLTTEVVPSGSAPFITSQPASATVMAGAKASFQVGATGTPPLSYQWRWNDGDISGATNDTLVLTDVQIGQAGRYSVRVSNDYGSVLSADALLGVKLPPTQLRLLSVSNALADTIVRVPVQLVAVGNENAIGFSISWSTSQLAFIDFVPNPALADASVFVNTNSAAIGRVGLLAGLNAGSTFAAGTQEVASVILQARVVTDDINRAGWTPITFTDVPIMRQVSDGAGMVLPAQFVNGTVYIVSNSLEGDVTPRPRGDRLLTATDWVVLGRYAAHLDSPTNAAEFQRADCAPRETLGDGEISVADWVQGGRYAAALDRPTVAGGPTEPKPPGSPDPAGLPPIAPGPSLRTLKISDGLAAPGQVAKVAVVLESQGDENALGFSLSFDAAALKFIDASLGTGSGAGVLNVNALDSATGRLGFALALPAGSKFVRGLTETVTVNFEVSPTASGTSELSLGGTLVKLETCGPDAAVLPTMYLAGAIQIDPRPPLRVEGIGNELVLAWPAWASNYVLQASAKNLSASGVTSWTNVTNVMPGVTNRELSVTLPVESTHRFYRLYSEHGDR